MPSELAQAVTRAAYGARQLPLVWYIDHSLVLCELAATVHRSENTKVRRPLHTHAPVPDRLMFGTLTPSAWLMFEEYSIDLLVERGDTPIKVSEEVVKL